MRPARHNRRHFELYSDPSVYSGKNVTLSSIPLDIWTEDSSTTLGTERNLVRTARDNTLNPSLINKLIRAEWLRNFKVHTEHLIVHKVKSESSIFCRSLVSGLRSWVRGEGAGSLSRTVAGNRAYEKRFFSVR